MRVLIADDERLVCTMLTDFVQACGHEVVGAVSGGGLAVIRAFAETRPDVVLLDVLMPRCNGLTVCHALLSRDPHVQVVLMSGMVEWNHPFVSGCKAAGFLRKPMKIEELRDLLAGMESRLALADQIIPLDCAVTQVAA